MGVVGDFQDGEASILMDASFWPVLINTYSGVTTEKLLRDSCAWLNDCLSKQPRRRKVVLIADTRTVPTTDSKIRKVAAEESKKLDPLMRAHNVETVVILDSPLLRGAIKAVGWISNLNLRPAKDLGEALRLAGELLASVGETLPIALTAATYRPPATPMRKSG
jgi:hypothetical protein